MSSVPPGAVHIATQRLARSARAKARQQYTLAEKMMIVRESQNSTISQAAISRKYSLGKNVLWTWRKSLAGISNAALDTHGAALDPGLLALEERVAELERLLGQKTLEIELLRNRLRLR